MGPEFKEILTSIILVTVIFGLFILSAILRIKNSWKVVSNANKPKRSRTIRTLDLVFSSIFLIASIIFYLIFVMNIRH